MGNTSNSEGGCLPILSPCCGCFSSQLDGEQLRNALSRYKAVQLCIDAYYGECYALQNHDGTHTHVLVRQSIDPKDLKFRAGKLQELRKWSDGPASQNLISTNLIASIERSGCLKTTQELYVTHDLISTDLKKQFQHRLQTNAEFSESEIKVIMRECTNGFVRMELIEYNSVRMEYIYFCGKEIKVAHPSLFNYSSNLAVVEQNSNAFLISQLYLSPQELGAFQVNNYQFVGGWASNSFTFGMIILSLMTMTHLHQLYNFQACEINFQAIDQLLKQAHNKYPYYLVSIVQDLLKPHQNARLNIRDLQTRINLNEPNNKLRNQLVFQQLGSANVMKTQDQQEQIEEEQTQNQTRQHQRKIQYPNYIAAFLKPRISLGGQYARLNEEPIYSANPTESIVANTRVRYSTKGGSYLGQTLALQGKGRQQPLREGKGLYQHPDGQTYLGEWHLGKMHGYGKLYFKDKRLRYQGEFKQGLFHGNGVEYGEEQIGQREAEIDEDYVRIFRGNWIRYEGHYQQDRRSGPGKIYFRKGYWRGNFKYGQPNGQGIYYSYMYERQTRGSWNNGERITQPYQQ